MAAESTAPVVHRRLRWSRTYPRVELEGVRVIGVALAD